MVYDTCDPFPPWDQTSSPHCSVTPGSYPQQEDIRLICEIRVGCFMALPTTAICTLLVSSVRVVTRNTLDLATRCFARHHYQTREIVEGSVKK